MRGFWFFIFIITFVFWGNSCKTTQKVRLKELYERISDEILGNNVYDTANAPSLASTKKVQKKEEEKKDRTKRRVFYGYPTRRAFAKRKVGKVTEYELIFILKKPVKTNPYVKEFYWYHRKKRKIMEGPIEPADQPYARIIHGPYVRRQGRKVLEEGIFYLGGKHGRWELYDRNNILIDKRKYYKGVPTEAQITYYDLNQEKPKEIIPIQLGCKDGKYYYFAEDGTILTLGQFKQDAAVGLWTEFYPNKRKKREIMYPREPFIDTKPYVLKEFDTKGKLIYDSRKDGSYADSATVKFF